MDERDTRAADRSNLLFLLGMSAFWLFYVAVPLLLGGLTRADGIVVAGVAVFTVGTAHIVRLIARSGRTVRSGPLAGLGLGDWWEVTEAVRQGRAVADARLADAAVGHARQQVRWQSVGRLLFPGILGLRALNFVFDAPEGAETTAHAVVTTVPLVALWVLNEVGYRRARESEEQNLRLSEPAFGRSGVE